MVSNNPDSQDLLPEVITPATEPGSAAAIAQISKSPRSIFEAIHEREGEEYEPDIATDNQIEATEAIPGTEEKIRIMAERVRRGLPLWHPRDRVDYEGLRGEG